MNTHTQKIAVITGASRGLGHAMACRLAQQGTHIVAIGRNIATLEALDDQIRGMTTLVPMDVLDYPALYRLAAALSSRFGQRLDMLIGCAATLPVLTLVHHYSPLEWETAMGVNCTANWHLMRAFHPLLKANPQPAQAIFVTDHTPPQPFWGAYRASKRALEEMVHTWQCENQVAHLSIRLLSPPPMHTQLRQQAMPGANPTDWANPADVADQALSESPVFQVSSLD